MTSLEVFANSLLRPWHGLVSAHGSLANLESRPMRAKVSDRHHSKDVAACVRQRRVYRVKP